MSHDERTRRGLAVQRRLQESGMNVKAITKKSRPDHMATLRKFRDGPGEGPGFVQVVVEGRKGPRLLVSEKKLADTAERMGGDETAAAYHYAAEMFTPEFRPRGLAHRGQIAAEDGFDEGLRSEHGFGVDVLADALHRFTPEWDGDEDTDDRVVILGTHGEMYVGRERDDGRVVLHGLDELDKVKAVRGGERMPLNVSRTLTVRISDEPTEDEEDEATAFDRLTRRSKTRGSP